MLLYLMIALFLFMGGMTKQSNWVFRLGILVLFLLTALRAPVLGGYDVLIYRGFFNNVPPLSDLAGYVSNFSIGYTVFNAFVKQFTDNYLIFQIVYSAISLYLLYAIISKLKLKDSEKCFWVFCYFCFHFFWNTWVTYRQNLATLLFWLFFVCCLQYSSTQHNKQKAFVFLLLALLLPPLLHTSAWVNLALLAGCWGLSKIEANKLIWLVPLGSVVLFLNSDFIYSHLLSWLTDGIDERYSMYTAEGARGLNLINLLLKMGFFIWFTRFYKQEQYPYKPMVLSFTAMTVLLGSVNAELMTRMYEYYAVGLYTCMALSLRHFSRNSKFIVMPLFLLLFLIIFVRSVIVFDNGEFLHYHFFFGY